MNTAVLAAVAWAWFALNAQEIKPTPEPPAPGAEPAKEPLYDGKTAAEWVKVLRSGEAADRERAAKAVKPAVAGNPAVLAALASALRDRESKVQAAAVETLTSAGSAAVPHLIQALWDEKQTTRIAAAFALTRLGPMARPAAVPLARLLGTDLGVDLRERIGRALVTLENYDVVPTVVPLLKNGNPLCRLLAAQVLAELEVETAQVLETYRGLLWDSQPDLRQVAASDLTIFGPEAGPVVPDLVKLLGDKDPKLRLAAARALGTVGSGARDSAAELLKVMKQDSDGQARLAAAEAAWHVARAPDVPVEIKAMLKSDKFADKVQAARLLWWIDRDDTAVKALVKVLETSEQHRAQAAEALARIGPEAGPGAKILGKWLEGNNEELRGLAAWYLGFLGEAARPFVPQLKALAKSGKNPQEEIRAVRSLFLLIREPEVSDLFKPLLAQESAEIRRATLGRLADYDKAILQNLRPVLRSALKDPDSQVRMDAAAALLKIDPSDAARTTLTQALADLDPETRIASASYLGYVLGQAGKSAVPALVQALWDEETQTRINAAEALGRIGPPAKEAIPALVVLLRTSGEPSGIYSSTAEALRLIGPPAKEALPELKALLHHRKGYVRVNAAFALWVLARDKTGIGELTSGLNHRLGRTRGYAAEALWFVCQDGRAIPTLIRLLDQNDPLRGNEQYIAARALGRIGPSAKAALPTLRRLLTHPDPILVEAARGAIRQIETEPTRNPPGEGPMYQGKTLDQWTAQAKDKKPEVRIDAAQALGKLGPAAIPVLTELLRDKEREVRAEAARALGTMGPQGKTAVPALAESLRGHEYPLFEAAAVLGNIGPEAKAAIPALIELLQHKHEDAADIAANALKKIGPAAIPALTELLKDKKGSSRLVAARALSMQGDQPRKIAISAFIDLFRDREAIIRISAAWALKDIGPEAKAAIPPLCELLQDRDDEAGMAAAFALGAMGTAGQEAIPALIRALRDRGPETQKAAAEVLGKMGPAAKDAVPVLTRLVREGRDDVQSYAVDALKKIQKEKPQN